MEEADQVLAGTVLDEQVTVTFDELCRSGHVDRHTVVELVRVGVVVAAGD